MSGHVSLVRIFRRSRFRLLLRRTLAKKLDAVHRNTVASSSAIPTACRVLLCGFFPSSHTLTTLAGERTGLSKKSSSYRNLLSFDTVLLRGLRGVEGVGSTSSWRRGIIMNMRRAQRMWFGQGGSSAKPVSALDGSIGRESGIEVQ